MFEHKKIQNLNDYFTTLDKRQDKGVYFYRINGYSDEIGQFIKNYYKAAMQSGVIIEGKIPNPDEKNLSYYMEVMGPGFQMDPGFIAYSLERWLPRMNSRQKTDLSAAMYDLLDFMRKSGKTENMLKNSYIKFMCWLYYKFERVVNQAGGNNIPKILYEGNISHYELMLLSALSSAGCDVVLLQYNGDQGYLKTDPMSKWSYSLDINGTKKFPEGFCLAKTRQLIQEEMDIERLYGKKPLLTNCTNEWTSKKGLDDIMESASARGSSQELFYNCYYRINGAEDRFNYSNVLYKFQLGLKNAKRHIVIVNNEIPKPSTDEIAGIKRNNYTKRVQMVTDLASNIKYTASSTLQSIMNKAFVDVVLMEAEKEGANLNKLVNRAVYLLCWLKRYQPVLFQGWKVPDIACFIYLGGCKDKNEAMFIKFLARLPVDVLILCPDLSKKCCLEDTMLYEINYTESLALGQYPEDNSQAVMGTVAFQAERELDTIMYQESGIYRNKQYAKAGIINLQTMYEEIKILWNEELKYRPGFSTDNGVVSVPVIFAKVSGVKDGEVAKYWQSVKELITEDTILIKNAPYIRSPYNSQIKAFATEFLKNGKLLKAKIKSHSSYKYGILREETQDFILEKLQIMLDKKLIKGTYENGTEYTIISIVLDLPKDIIRLIQKFDFTKKNPKLIYINATEDIISLEDTIITSFLNLAGFDIVFFVPTGYQSIEKYFNSKIMEEHQLGEYLYDLKIPDFGRVKPGSTRTNWFGRIFNLK